MTAADELREVSERLAFLLERAAPIVGAEFRPRLSDAVTRLRETRWLVVTIGQFKRGKSTLVNALTRRDGLLPVDVDVTTSIPTTVAYGESEEATVNYAERSSHPTTVADLARYVSELGNPGNERGVRSVDVVVPAAELRGLVYADTPGIGGLNVEHTAVTLEYTINADVLLFVTSTDGPLSTVELDFLADVAPYAAAIVVAMTKVDHLPEPEVDLMIKDTLNKIAARLEVSAEDLVIVGVSAKRMLAGLREGDLGRIDESNVPELEAAIWHAIGATGARALVTQIGSDFSRELERLAKPLGAELAVRQAEGAERREEITQQMTEVKTRADRLADVHATWKSSLRVDLDAMRDRVEQAFQSRVHEAGHRLDSYLKDPESRASPEAVGVKVVRDVTLALTEAEVELRRSVSELILTMRGQAVLELAVPVIDPMTFRPVENAPQVVFEQKASLAKKVLEVGPKALAGGKTYRKLGALIGWGSAAVVGVVVAPPVLIVGAGAAGVSGASALVGAAAGLKNGIEEVQAATEQERTKLLRSLLEAFLEDNARRAMLELSRAMDAIRRQIIANAEATLREERTSVDEAVAAVRRADDEARDDAARRAELERELERLSSMNGEVSELIRTALGAGTEPDVDPLTHPRHDHAGGAAPK